MRRLILLGVVSYVGFLVAQFPAANAYVLASDILGNQLTATRADGTLWSGQLNHGRLGNLPYESLAWSINPLALFLGRVETQLEMREGTGFARGTAAAYLGGRLTGSNIELKIPAATAAPLLPVKSLTLGGSINAAINVLEVVNRKPARIEGTAVWSDASITVGESVPLGSFRAEITTQEGRIRTTVRDSGGPVEIEALAQLDEAGRYRVTGNISTRPSANAGLAQMIKMSGRPGRDGRIPINIVGNLD